MIASLLLAVAIAGEPQTTAPSTEPTPEEIYAAGRTPYAAMVKAYELRQDFVEQADGTFLGVVRPSFEQEQKLPPLRKEQYSNLLGPWDAVERRIGSVHDKNGKLASIQTALGIKDTDKTTYLVATGVDSQAKPGVHVCVTAVTGVSESQPPGFKKPELLPRRFGALVGCGLIKDVLVVVDESKMLNAKSFEEASQIRNEVSDKIAHALGYKITRFGTVIDDTPKDAADSSKGGN